VTFHVASRQLSPQTLAKRYPGAEVLDLTSRGPLPWLRFSPFFPHHGIPVPFSPGEFGASVEGIWQGLKVFENEGIDRSKITRADMKNLKRSVRKFGRVLGHQAGLSSLRLLAYREAREEIYLPCYLWVLENKLQDEVRALRELGATRSVVLLDFETNTDLDDLSKPLSHAGLVQRFLEGRWPLARPVLAPVA
jgi:hypothetical protein